MSYRIPQYRQEEIWREQERQDRYDFKREELETELQDEYIPSERDWDEYEMYLDALEVQQEARRMREGDRW
tara:strand:+ start:1423 stop:1635 length:213 start_codon:yes stop_codon:yes gene_type:complete